MRVGFISDIHGNRTALDAVVADGEACGVDRWLALGDLAMIGPEPVRTLERLVELRGIGFTRGNTDRYLVTDARPRPIEAEVAAQPELLARFDDVTASMAWTVEALRAADWLDWVAALPFEQRIDLPDGTRLLGVHASPRRDDGDGISPDRPAADLADELAGAAADLVLAGHTHRPTDRRVPGVHAVNLGSVGMPITDDVRASYVIVHADRDGYRIEHRRVAYDVDGFLVVLARSGHPTFEFIASFVRGEQRRHPSVGPGMPPPIP